jgi:hypothetical protein
MHLVQVDEVLVALIRHSLKQYFCKFGTLSNSDHSSAYLKHIVTLKIVTLLSLQTSEEMYCSTLWNNAGTRKRNNTQNPQSKSLEFCFVQINFLVSFSSSVV